MAKQTRCGLRNRLDQLSCAGAVGDETVPRVRARRKLLPRSRSSRSASLIAAMLVFDTGFDRAIFSAISSRCAQGAQMARNVRQLRNVIERAVILARSHRLSLRDLPREFGCADPPQRLKIRLGSSREEVDHELIFQTVAFARTQSSRVSAVSVAHVVAAFSQGCRHPH